MTANEMADSLDQKLDRAFSNGSPGYEDFDYTSVLTEAQQFYVKKFFDELNNRKSKGFQETEIRNQGLGGLIKSPSSSLTVSASQLGILPNEVFYDLPTDHMYTTYEHCVINKLVCGSTVNYIVADVVPVGENEIRRLEDNKYKKPFYKSYGNARVWRTEYSRATTGILPSAPATAKRHGLITDGTFSVTAYIMRYLKNPLDIVVNRTTVANQRNCELDISTHSVIVDIAQDLMLSRIKEQKLQINESFKDLE